MANIYTVRRIYDVLEKANEVDVDKVVRPDYGPVGLPALVHDIQKVRRELKIIASVGDEATEQRLENAIAVYGEYVQTLYSIQSMGRDQFTAQRNASDEALTRLRENTRETWPYFATLALDKSGMIDAPSLAIEKIAATATLSEETIKSLIQDATNRAKAEATRIEEAARQTAKGFSVLAAQDQFDHAKKSLFRKAIGWGILAISAFSGFLFFAFYIYLHPPSVFSDKPGSHIATVPEAIYLVAIRITILTAIGALVSFSLKMLRAHMHMSEFNDHRRRVANSMAAFVESAQTPEQRDQIFGRLVDAVVVFGDSGLLDKEAESIGVPSVAIEAITKNLSSK